MDRLAGLNAAQREAVTTLSGPLLVLAGAGTGKTRVVTVRIAELVAHGVSPDAILSVTFTNKAAKEMLQRTEALLGKRRRGAPRPFISTFHSLCVRILRQEIEVLGYPADFAIYDRGDQESAARTALREIKVTDAVLKPGDLVNRISRWKMLGIHPEAAGEHVEEPTDFLAAVGYRKYQKLLRAAGAVDFDDLLLLVLRLFDEHPDVLARQQRRFGHVQVDEYQDTNAVQFALVEALVRPHRNLCVVGDDDQSIYGWRGAEVEHILGFERHFPGAKVIRLEENYRCTEAILEMANRLVAHNRGRHPKRLRANKPTVAPVRFFAYPDELAEAEGVVREIEYLHSQLRVPLGDFAILFRTNEQPRIFEGELRRRNLRYVLLGAQSFFDRKEVKDILSYLRTILHPSDDASLRRIVNVPARGIGTATVEKLLTRAVREGCSLFDALPAALSAGEVTAKTAAAVDKFRDLLDRYRRAFADHPRELPTTLSALLHEIDYESEIVRQHQEAAQQILRTGVLDQFVDAAKQYVERADDASLAGFLEEVALAGPDDGADKEKRLAEDALKLLTLHGAKGLEFPRVYLVGLEEGILPHKRSVEGDAPDVSEERRLTYVGLTRARDHLTITRAEARRKWGKNRPAQPSRFLFEMRGDTALPTGTETASAAEDVPESDLADEALI